MPPPTKVEIHEAVTTLLLADQQGLIGYAERVRIGQIVNGKTPPEQLAYAQKTLDLANKGIIKISNLHRANLERIAEVAKEQEEQNGEAPPGDVG